MHKENYAFFSVGLLNSILGKALTALCFRLSLTFAYICVVIILLCPNSFDTVYRSPSALLSNIFVAKLCRPHENVVS